MLAEHTRIEVLLIDDDEDEFLLAKEALADIGDARLSLHWRRNFADGLSAVEHGDHQVCLLDRRLGERDGLELLREATALGVRIPIIVLTAGGDTASERAAMAAGAADFLAKSDLDADRLARAIRHALERRRYTAIDEERERQFRAVFEGAADAIAITKGTQGIIAQWNGGAAHLFGYSAEEAMAGSARMLVPPDRMAEWEDLQRRVEGGERIDHFETLRQRKDGSLVEVSIMLAPMTDADGRVVGACSITRDISEMTRMRARLAMADRLAAVGQLAAGVGHEINNPLAYVMTNLDYATNEVQKLGARGVPVSEVLDSLREVKEGAERIRATSRDLKLFARGDEDRRGPVDVRRVVESSINMAWNEIRHRARLLKELAATPTIDGNESRLGQVVLNLLINAAQAIPEGSDAEIRVTTSVADDRVLICVADTGCGISPTQMRRLFEPFHTTKPVGVGTGLGLSICRDIVTGLGGTITVTSEVGRGSAFTIAIPIGRLLVDVAASAPVATPSAARRGRVLIVDDEVAIGRGLERLLRAEHDVQVVTTAQEALIVLQGATFDIVLCDLMMPVMSGMDLHARLLELGSSAADGAERSAADGLVFMTGGAFTAKTRAFLDRVPNMRLDKPIESRALRALVHDRVRLSLPA